eukprot:COSAG01_NODE_38200_length_492_cov_37.460560_1_plen_158_part_10
MEAIHFWFEGLDGSDMTALQSASTRSYHLQAGGRVGGQAGRLSALRHHTHTGTRGRVSLPETRGRQGPRRCRDARGTAMPSAFLGRDYVVYQPLLRLVHLVNLRVAVAEILPLRPQAVQLLLDRPGRRLGTSWQPRTRHEPGGWHHRHLALGVLLAHP